MYIIAIAWIYVVLMMAITETSLTASIMTFLFYCVLPLALFFYLFNTPKKKQKLQVDEKMKSSVLSSNNQTQEKPEATPINEVN